ncbi:MAG: hypothetical protein HY587_05390 [Candidatus Omnitrophica bacterium]|nr:hypothetical protein [Candidatus Omnitrophota bacterium]
MLKRDSALARLNYDSFMKAYVYLLIFAFVVTQCDFVFANDAPVLGPGGLVAPVMNVNSESMEDAEGERRIRIEEENQRKDAIEKSKLLPGDENPLSIPKPEIAEKIEEIIDDRDDEKSNSGRGKETVTDVAAKSHASSAAQPVSVLTPPFFISNRDLITEEKNAQKAEQKKLDEEKRNEERSQREEAKSITEEVKKIVHKITSDNHRDKKEDDISEYLPVSKDRKALKHIVEDIISSSKGRLTSPVVTSSNIPVDATSISTPIPGAALTTPVTDSSVNLSTASAESNANRANLVLQGPQSYVLPLSKIAATVIQMITTLVSAANNPDLIGVTEGMFAHSIELLKLEIETAIIQIVDLQNVLQKLVEEQRSISHEFDTEVALVNKFAKAISTRSTVTKAELERIIASTKPVYIDDDYLLQVQSMLVYVETQLSKLEEIQTRRSQFLNSLRKADFDTAEMKEQLRETSKMLINVEILKSLAQATKTQLIQVFQDLQKSHERLRDAVEKIRLLRTGLEKSVTLDALAAKDHVFHVYATAMEVRERTRALNALKDQIREEAKNNYAAIVEYYGLLRQIDTSRLENPTKEEVEALRGHAERLVPPEQQEIAGSSDILGDTSKWEYALRSASNLELMISASISGNLDLRAVGEMSVEMKGVVREAERLARMELDQADNAEIQARNVEALARGFAKRLELLLGYSLEIQKLLAREGIVIDLVH